MTRQAESKNGAFWRGKDGFIYIREGGAILRMPPWPLRPVIIQKKKGDKNH